MARLKRGGVRVKMGGTGGRDVGGVGGWGDGWGDWVLCVGGRRVGRGPEGEGMVGRGEDDVQWLWGGGGSLRGSGSENEVGRVIGWWGAG